MSTARNAAVAAFVCATIAPAGAAQSRANFSGAWVVDQPQVGAADVYGEIRVVRRSDIDVRVTMIDYGTAHVAGSFRDVLRIMPWTFPVNTWAPRRGPATSSQPRARARWTDAGLLLEKLTARGNGDVDRSWHLSDDGTIFTERIDDADRLIFRKLADDALLPERSGIAVQIGLDSSTLLLRCPADNCRVVEFYSGRQISVSPLPRAVEGRYRLGAELRIEPAP